MDPEGATSSSNGSASGSPSKGTAPMSDFNINALTALRVELKSKVEMGPHLIDILEIAAGGFMTKPEAQSVRSDDESQMGRLIEILQGKGDKEFDIFCEMLRMSNYSVWANELKQEAKAQKEVLRRKRSPSSASSRETPAKKRTMDEYVKMKTDVEMQDAMSMQDCKAVAPVVPLDYDVEMNDHRYLEKAMKKACKNREQDPRVLMKALYANTFDCVEDILVRNEQHSESIVRAARTTIKLELAEGDAKALTTTLTVSELLEKLCISTKWDDTYLLERIVSCLPKKARTLARNLLDRYDLYLDVYDDVVKVKDSLKDAAAALELTKAHIPVEVTLAKDVNETTQKDCKEMLAQLLYKAFNIPRTSIMVAEARSDNSTTIVCIITKAFMMNIVKYSGEASALWAYQELSVTRIRIPDLFEVNVSQLLTQHFNEALCSGLTGDMDFISATKALPYQVYALLDLDRTEQLVVRTIHCKIVRPWSEQEESVPETADNEEVERTPETVSPSEGRLPPKVEETEETMEVEKDNKAAGNVHAELLSRVQELEDELKDSEQKRWELIHGNTALQNKLEATREEEGHIHQEMASLKETLLSVLSSQAERPPPPPAPPSAPPHPLPPPPEHNVEAEVKELAAHVQQAQDEKSELEMENSALRKELIQQADKYSHQMKLITQSLPSSDTVSIAMLQAAVNGDQSVVQFLVKRFVNTEGKDGRTPLLLAAERGHTDLVRKLAGQYEGDIFHKMKNSRNALHLAAYRGHLPVLQYLCSMFGDRVLDRDGNGETCLDIAHRLGRKSIAEFLTQNYPRLQRKGGADMDPSLTASSVGPSKRAHRRRWWLKVSTESRDVTLHPSSPMEQAEGSVEMVGEVEFRRDATSNLMKAVSGTEWMYHRGALERGRRAAAAARLLNQSTRYHQRWLADCVQEEEEESCNQWLLQESVSDTADDEGSGGGLPPEVEEAEETMEVGINNEAAGNVHGELLFRIQELEDELKDSEQKRIHNVVALQNKLEATREEKGRIHLEMANLEARLLSVLSSQVEQPPPQPAPPSAPPPPLPPPPAHNVEAEAKELTSHVQQAQDEKSELEMDISVLQKELIQQSLPSSDTISKEMLQAAVNGNQSVVQFLVKRFVNTEGKDGRTPLLLAAERGHTDLVRKLAGQYEGDIFHKMKNSRNALHLAAYRGHLPVLQCLCPMFGDRVLDRDGNDETCLDIARRLGRKSIAEFLTQNYSQLEDKGGAAKDPSPTASSDGPSKRAHRCRWWLKVSTESRDVALHPSAPMEQADSIVEMEGEVEFRRGAKSKLMKAVSGTDWMYRRGALERGRRAAAAALLLHRFTRYHQRWLADCVQTEEEESCKQWLLHQSPEVATVREAEEYRPGRVRYRYTTGVGLPAKMMDEAYKQALRDNQEKVAGVIVMNILPDLRPYLTDIEYSQVESMQPDNRAQVNELFRVLLMKEDAHFFSFCHALECNGYWHWAQQLQEASSAHIHAGAVTTVTPPIIASFSSPLETALVNARDVIKALNHQLDAQWREFGTFLYVEPAIMNEISLHKSNVAACMELLVEKWLYHENGTGDLPRTWKTVVQAVNDVGKRLLAQQLAKHIPPSTSVSTDFSGSSLATSVHRNLLYSPQRKTESSVSSTALSGPSVGAETSHGSRQSEICKVADVVKALNHQLDAKWREFGTFLHVEPAIMNGINKDNPTVGECMLQLMEKWVCHDSGTGDLPRTWETVVQALKDTGVEALAQQLAKYAATSTLVSTDLSGSSLATSVHLNLPYFRQKTTESSLPSTASSGPSVGAETSHGSPQSEICKVADVIKALNHQLDAQWELFGAFLHVEPAILHGIRKDKLYVEERMLLLVEKWLYYEAGTGDLPRTWKTVVHVLKATEFNALADELAKQHGVQLFGQ